MVGRHATQRMTWREIKELYDLTRPDLGLDSQPRFNIAPTQQSLVVRQHENGEREAIVARWGLVPLWAKSIEKTLAMFNAMSETVETKPTFRAAWKSRPCLVVTSGFYEWAGKTPKQPYFVTRRDEQPFAFGGLWEAWRSSEGPELLSYTILTVPPNDFIANVHHRMPVMLAPDQWAGWLSTPEARKALCTPFPSGEMEMWPVSRKVSTVTNEGPELAEPTGAIIHG
jgi:putative SOS response-associated peptidase YedK